MTPPRESADAASAAEPPPPRLLVFGLAAAIVLLAVALAVLAASRRPAPRKRPPAIAVRAVQTAPVRREPLTPSVTGHGRVRAASTIAVAARTGGEVLRRHPLLEAGLFVEAGLLAVELDPADARLGLERARAQERAAEAELRRLELEAGELERRRALARETLALRKAESERVAALARRGLASERDLDLARAERLRAADALAALESTIATQPERIAAARARLAEAQAQRALAERQLERTRVLVPVAGQIASVAVEPHAQVAAGQTLFTLHDTSRLEIPVAVPISRALLLAPGLRVPSGGAGAGRLRIEATIAPSAVVGGPRWSGTVQRFEPIDATAQTVPAVVVLAPRPGADPPPVGLFCSVELRGGPALPGPFLPRAALYEGGVVWTVQDGKLAARRVETGVAFGDWIEVRAGLEGVGEVIVSPLERPLPGEPARRLGAGAQGPGAAARAAGSGAGGA